MEIHNPAISDLKCPTCILNFDNQNQHKEHYKSDFHRYNLKRKMVKLAPATFQQFKAKRNQVSIEQTPQFKCNQCGKKFGSNQTLQQHLQSKKHSQDATPKQTTIKSPSQTIVKKKYVKNSKMCLFCNVLSANFSQNLRHMQSSHSFFIAQNNYCVNQQGLVEYLQEKIQIGFMCITCQNKNAKDFSSGDAVKKHMTTKGHTFMKIDEGFDEYLEFYDFSSQFKQILQEQKDKHVPGIQYTTLKVVVKDQKHLKQIEKGKSQDKNNQKQNENQNQNQIQNEEGQWQDQQSSDQQQQAKQQKNIKKKQQSNDDDDWQQEQDEDEEQVKQNQIKLVQIKQKQQQIQQNSSNLKKTHKVKTFHLMRPTQTSNGQLLLPNGKILGHRKYRYLYRQTYRAPFWLNRNMKSIGFESYNNNAIVCRQKILNIIKHDNILSKHKTRWNKIILRNGMQNNMQKYFRTRNSL